MTWKTRLLIRESAFTATVFTVATYVYYFVAVWSVQDHFIPGPLRDYLVSNAVHVELLSFGVLFGGLIGVFNRVTDTPGMRNRPIAQIVVLRSLLFLAGFGVVSLLIFVVFATAILTPNQLAAMFRDMSPRYGLSFVVWLVTTVGVISLALEVERVLGAGNLSRLFLGRYRRPRNQERVFLFMDLKGSTAIAERLGHERYSSLLQQCYRDLSPVVLRHEASIYQYVGDEVVLSWHTDPTRMRREAVGAFFAFQEILARASERYRREFGLAPEFRGGIDAGPVTVIEIGDVKREIAFHGDVLNTAARLLETCKTRNESLAVSATVGEAVCRDPDQAPRWRGSVSLRGKQDPVEIYILGPPESGH